MTRWHERRLGLLATLAGASALLWLSCAWFHDKRLEHKFDRLASGMTNQQVIASMGSPDADEPCGKLGGFPASCSHELRYEPRLPTITSYVVFIDARGIVVDKYIYQSP